MMDDDLAEMTVRKMAKQAERIKELEADRERLENWICEGRNREEELAAQNQAMRQQLDYFQQPDNLKETSDAEYREWVISLSKHYLALPDLATPIINKERQARQDELNKRARSRLDELEGK